MVELDGKNTVLTGGDTILIPEEARHRVGVIASECVILEIAYERFEEKDIVRVEDDYNRTSIQKTRAVIA